MTKQQAAEVLIEMSAALAKKGELYPKHYQALVIACGELMIDTVLEERVKPQSELIDLGNGEFIKRA